MARNPFIASLALPLVYFSKKNSRSLSVWTLFAIIESKAVMKAGYRIYSINRPGRLLNFWTLRVGAYSRWALIWGWALIKFLPFSASEVCLFCNKTINSNNKTRRSNKVRFLQNTLKKTPSSGKSLIRIYSLKWVGWRWALIWVWMGGGGGARLFEAGRFLTFSAFRMGANSRLGAYLNKYGSS